MLGINEVFGDVWVTVDHLTVLHKLTCIEAPQIFRYPLFSEFISQANAGLVVDSPVSI